MPKLEKMVDNVPIIDIKVDESKRPLEAKNLLPEYKELSAKIEETMGTYIKIEDEI